MISSYVVIADGIRIPVKDVSMSWSSEATARLSLVSSTEAERILPSTHIHIFKIDPHAHVFQRRAVDFGDIRIRPQTRLLQPEKTAETVLGKTQLPYGATEDGYSYLDQIVSLQGMIYRWGGEVISVNQSEQPGGAAVVLTCQGYGHLLARVQAMQLMRGFGTLTDAERKFFGQSEPVFQIRGRNGFSRGFQQILQASEHDLTLAVSLLARRYFSRVSRMWAMRSNWTRIVDQISHLDSDGTLKRLMQTQAFERYLRDVFQQSYQLSISTVMLVLLDFINYHLVALPSPFYVPFYASKLPDPARQRRGTTRTRGGLTADVRIPGYSGFDYVELASIVGDISSGVVDRIRKVWVPNQGQEVPIPEVDFRSARVRGSVSTSGVLTFTPPQGSVEGNQRQSVDLSELRGDVLASRSIVWRIFDDQTPLLDILNDMPAGESVDLSLPWEVAPSPTGAAGWPGAIPVSVSRRPDVVRTAEPPPPPPEPPVDEAGRPSQWISQLRSHVMIPNLWWAAPPVCNIIVREDIKALSLFDAGMDKPTRMLGRIAPGLSGSRRSFIDKFFAPRTADFEEAATSDESGSDRDPNLLAPYEYIGGVVPQLRYFDKMSRLVRSSDWEDYISTMLDVEFWQQRIGRQAQISMRPNQYIVPGFPAVVIRNTDSSPGEIDPEVARLRLRRRALADLLQSFQECIRRNSPSGAAARLLKLLQILSIYRGLLNIPDLQRAVDAVRRAAGQGLSAGAAVRTSEVSGLTASTEFRRIAEVFGRTPLFAGSGGGTASAATTTTLRLLGPAAQLRSSLISAPSSAGLDFAVNAGISASDVRRLLPSYPEAVETLTGLSGRASGGIPSTAELSRWFQEADSRARAGIPCVNALRRDVRFAEDELRAVEQRLAELGSVGTGNPSVLLGLVVSVEESTSAPGDRGMVVTLSNVRELGEDLNWDGVASDELENLVTFGENGYLDERYRGDRIGQDVYRPLLGCGGLEEVVDPLDPPDDEAPLAESDPLEDLWPQFQHPEVCGSRCGGGTAAAGALSGARINDLVTAFYDKYIQKRETLREEELREWLQEVRSRPGMSFVDAYRGAEIVMGDTETQETVLEGMEEGDSRIYPDSTPPRGFYAATFLSSDPSPEDVAVAVGDMGEREAVPVDAEYALLVERRNRILDFVRSLSDGTYIRR